MSEPRLPARVAKVIDTVRSGQNLVKTFRYKESGDTEVVFQFYPSGRRAPPKSSEEAIASGLLNPLGDGLFGAETSQTWSA